MNSHTEATLNIQDIPRIFSRYWISIMASTLCGTVLFTAFSFHVPKKYKAYFVLTIYSKYFQSPLIGDFVPELSESGEIRSQRESLIRQVLAPEYLDALGQKYAIYWSQARPKSPLNVWMEKMNLAHPRNKDSLLSEDREDLRSRIQIDSLNNTTFKVGFVSSKPDVAYNVTQDIYAEIIRSLLDLRKRTMANVRDAIQKRLESLSVSMAQPASTAPPVLTGSQAIKNELESVRSQIRAMTAEYTDQHPIVIQLREKEKSLQDRLAAATAEKGSSAWAYRERPALGGTADSNHDIFGDLTKKLNYINIAIDSDQEHQSDYFATLEPPLYPSSALGPKKILFALWGFAFGLCGSLFVAAIREYFDRSTLHASSLAHHLHVPLLGELPPFPSKAAR